MKDSIELSIVVPAYNEEDNVVLLYDQLKDVLRRLKKSYEVIFIDDGSKDNTFKKLKLLHEKDKRIKVIRFRKNFGKAAALSAGFSKSRGEIIITMDADLQDDPKEIPRFLDSINKGYDLVVGWKQKRKDPITKKIASKVFNLFIRTMNKIRIHDSDCNFRAIKKFIVKDISIYSGLYRYIPLIAYNQGAKVGEIKVVHHPRKHGKSKYGFERLLNGSLDLLTIKFLLSFNKRPLHLFGGVGLLFFLLGFIIGAYLIYVKYFFNELIGNRPLLILSLLLIVLGIQFISTGLIGEMITSTTHEPEKQYAIMEEL